MKTSNKLLLVLTLAFLLSLTSLMIYAKSNLTTWNEAPSDETNNTTIIYSEFSANVLRLDADYTFHLDNHSRGVKIKASEEIMGFLKVADEDSVLSFYREGVRDLPFGTRIDVYIGIEGKENLEIIVGNNARVRGSGVLKFNNLKMKIDDNANVKFEISAEELNLQAENNTRLNLDGFAKKTIIKSIDNASLNARDFSTTELVIDVVGNSVLNLNFAEFMSGSVRDNSVFSVESNDNSERLTRSGNAAINIR